MTRAAPLLPNTFVTDMIIRDASVIVFRFWFASRRRCGSVAVAFRLGPVPTYPVAWFNTIDKRNLRVVRGVGAANPPEARPRLSYILYIIYFIIC